jgi:hypothetical protein
MGMASNSLRWNKICKTFIKHQDKLSTTFQKRQRARLSGDQATIKLATEQTRTKGPGNSIQKNLESEKKVRIVGKIG